jgi:hypothetical protein
MPWSGAVTPSSPASTAISISSDQSVSVSGTLTGPASVDVAFQDSLTNSIVSSAYNSPGGFTLATTGSAYSCSQPVKLDLSASNSASYDLTITVASLGKFNTGSASIPTATPLAINSTSQRVCDQVCGNLLKRCGDIYEYYSFTLPANKGVVIQVAFQSFGGGANFDFDALQGDGNAICALVSNQISGALQTFYKARIVNNSPNDQVVVLTPNMWGSPADFWWNLAVAVEP